MAVFSTQSKGVLLAKDDRANSHPYHIGVDAINPSVMSTFKQEAFSKWLLLMNVRVWLEILH